MITTIQHIDYSVASSNALESDVLGLSMSVNFSWPISKITSPTFFLFLFLTRLVEPGLRALLGEGVEKFIFSPTDTVLPLVVKLGSNSTALPPVTCFVNFPSNFVCFLNFGLAHTMDVKENLRAGLMGVVGLN